MGRLYREAGKVLMVLAAKDAPTPAGPQLRYAAARGRRRPRRKKAAPVPPPPGLAHPMTTFRLRYGQYRRLSYWWSFAAAELARMLPI